jgi:hypothetical protein
VASYRRDLTGANVRGVPALVWFAMITRIQKSDMSIMARLNLAVKYFSLIRAKFLEDPEFNQPIAELQKDLELLRDQYEPLVESETWASDQFNQFCLNLDGIEYRLDEIMVKTKIIDNAGLGEIQVPE